MTTLPFIQPRFVGERFEAHTLPVSAAKDLAAYEELVLELAKHIYRENHLDRTRVPKGFPSALNLHFEKIDQGSAVPKIVALLAGGQLLQDLPSEFYQARDLFNEVVATSDGQPLPSAFPKQFYSYFNRIGRSLKEGEEIQWTPDTIGNVSSLTPSKRKRLVLAHRETYESPTDVIGAVEAMDARKRTGRLRALHGDLIDFTYDDPFLAELKSALGSKTTRVRIQGVGEYDVNDRLNSIIEIDQMDELPHYALIAAIEELADLREGWLEGCGKAPLEENLSWLNDELTKVFPDDLEHPTPVPTEEGNVSLEWIRPLSRTELEVNFLQRRLELYSTNTAKNEFIEDCFEFNQWGEALNRVKGII